MKKATLTFGLFSLIVLTSFTQVSGDTGGTGSSSTPPPTGNQGGAGTTIGPIGGGNKKDFTSSQLPVKVEFKNESEQSFTFRQKSDN